MSIAHNPSDRKEVGEAPGPAALRQRQTAAAYERSKPPSLLKAPPVPGCTNFASAGVVAGGMGRSRASDQAVVTGSAERGGEVRADCSRSSHRGRSLGFARDDVSGPGGLPSAFATGTKPHPRHLDRSEAEWRDLRAWTGGWWVRPDGVPAGAGSSRLEPGAEPRRGRRRRTWRAGSARGRRSGRRRTPSRCNRR